MKLLLAGVSARALAQSAVNAGYHVEALDYFGDRDLSGLVKGRSLSRVQDTSYSARDLPDLAQGMSYDALVYVANLENHPDVVNELAGGRPVFGNPPNVLREVRHWPTLRRVCAEEHLAMPLTLFPGEESCASPGTSWLRKPVRSGGGHGIRKWDRASLKPNSYLQALVPGVSASAVFAANGRQCTVLGLSEQLIGQSGLGAGGFRHCGNVMPLAPELGGGPEFFKAVQGMLDVLTRRFQLRGICGADFIVVRDKNDSPVPMLLEINPRPSSSAELLERAAALSVFDIHVSSSAGILPPGSNGDFRGFPGGMYHAKGIVFAQKHSIIPEAMPEIGCDLCDVGQPGDMVSPGRPICSILTSAHDRVSALQRLHAAAQALQTRLAICKSGSMDDASPLRN